MATSATSHAPSVADRRVLLLLLDNQNRLMLCGGCCGGWTVPQALLAAGTDFKDGAAQYLAGRFTSRILTSDPSTAFTKHGSPTAGNMTSEPFHAFSS